MKLATIIFCILAQGYESRAQESIGGDFIQLGIKAGLNRSTAYTISGMQMKVQPMTGYVAGFFLSMPLSKSLGVQQEILFSQKGFHATGAVQDETYSVSRKSGYIDVPLLFSYRPSTTFSIFAGPLYSAQLYQTDQYSQEATLIQRRTFSSAEGSKHMLGFTVGTDINFNKFVIGVRAAEDLWKSPKVALGPAPRYRNAWIQITVGYRLYYKA